MPEEKLQETPLHDLWAKMGATLGPFSGYSMPIRFPAGTMAEHQACREQAALFDVSHMGQFRLQSKSAAKPFSELAEVITQFTPNAIATLKEGKCRYSVFLNKNAGIIDDFICAHVVNDKGDPRLDFVANAGNKNAIFDLVNANLPNDIELTWNRDFALLALQGPMARAVLSTICAEAADTLTFMTVGRYQWNEIDIGVSCSGYTGEDGFEISVASGHALTLATTLLADSRVTAAGLSARDSLRLEAGLPLHGADISPSTTPFEAGLDFIVSEKKLRESPYAGSEILQRQRNEGLDRKLVGIALEGRAPARAHTLLKSESDDVIGEVTSGLPSPTQKRPIALAYIKTGFNGTGQSIFAEIRGKLHQAHVVDLPFVAHNYRRKL